MKSIKLILITVFCSSILFTSCASKPSELGTTFVSPAMYSNYDCDQISTEMMRYNNQVTELTAQQSKVYKNDQMMGWVGTFFLWPLYLFIKGDGEVAAELKSAKGTLEALQKISVEKKCGY